MRLALNHMTPELDESGWRRVGLEGNSQDKPKWCIASVEKHRRKYRVRVPGTYNRV